MIQELEELFKFYFEKLHISMSLLSDELLQQLDLSHITLEIPKSQFKLSINLDEKIFFPFSFSVSQNFLRLTTKLVNMNNNKL